MHKLLERDGIGSVRRATFEDWPQVARHYIALLTSEETPMTPKDLANCGRYIQSVLNDPQHAIILLDDGVGQAICTDANETPGRMMVWGLYIEPEARGRGIITLLRACKDEAAYRGIGNVEFYVNADSDTGFYERMGCKLVSRVYRFEVDNVE